MIYLVELAVEVVDGTVELPERIMVAVEAAAVIAIVPLCRNVSCLLVLVALHLSP